MRSVTLALTTFALWSAPFSVFGSEPIQIDGQIGEFLVPGEAQATARLMKLFGDHMKRQYEAAEVPAQRAVHAKGHGCMNAEFEVFDHRDRQLQYGVFRSPRIYSAFVRLSNGDGPAGADTDKLISIGLAVKLVQVGEPKLLPAQQEATQDLLFINQPAFLVKDINEFAKLIRAREGNVVLKGIFAATHPASVIYRRSASPKDNPMNTPYWSALAFRLGDTAVKYSARPCVSRAKVSGESDDFLAALLKNHIENEDACFDFYLQKKPPGVADSEMPIENARVEWDEQKYAPVRVGQLRIPRQLLLRGGVNEICERSQFTPWNTTSDFRPLGNLNRIRRAVYELSAKERHRINRTENPFFGRSR